MQGYWRNIARDVAQGSVSQWRKVRQWPRWAKTGAAIGIALTIIGGVNDTIGLRDVIFPAAPGPGQIMDHILKMDPKTLDVLKKMLNATIGAPVDQAQKIALDTLIGIVEAQAEQTRDSSLAAVVEAAKNGDPSRLVELLRQTYLKSLEELATRDAFAPTRTATSAALLGIFALDWSKAKAAGFFKEAAELEPDNAWHWIYLAHAQAAMGQSDEARVSLQRADNSARHDRTRMVILNQRVSLGFGFEALPVLRHMAERGFAIAKRLVAANPQDAEAQRDLSISLGQLGDLALRANDVAEARRIFVQSHEIRKHLTKVDPQNDSAQRDLSISLIRFGGLALRANDVAEARRLFDQSHEIFKGLVAADPQNAGARRDLSTSLGSLGDLTLLTNDVAEARRLFGQSHEIRKSLAAADLQNAQAQGDLSSSLLWLGDLALREGDAAQAQMRFEESLEIQKTLAAADPRNPQLQFDVGYMSGKLGLAKLQAGELIQARNDFIGAKAAFDLALEIITEDDEMLSGTALNALNNSVAMAFLHGDPVDAVARARRVLAKVNNSYEAFAIMHFYIWLANPAEMTPQEVAAAIDQSLIKAFTWRFYGFEPLLAKLPSERKRIAEGFIAHFEGRLDLAALKAIIGGPAPDAAAD